jgi:hypothetical protein
MPLASPLDPPAPPLTVTGSVGSGFPIGSGDSSMLLFEAFLESVVLPSGFSLTMYYGHKEIRKVTSTRLKSQGMFYSLEDYIPVCKLRN